MDKKIEIIRSFKYIGKGSTLSFSLTAKNAVEFKEFLFQAVLDVEEFIKEDQSK